MRALIWESSCMIENTFEKHCKSICQRYVSALVITAGVNKLSHVFTTGCLCDVIS